MDDSPLANGSSGRTKGGRFAKGNSGGPGNPYSRRVAELRGIILAEVSEDDLRGIVRALVEQAKGGDIAATKELLNRLVGKSPDSPHSDRLAVDERCIEAERLQAEARARCNKPSRLDLLVEEMEY